MNSCKVCGKVPTFRESQLIRIGDEYYCPMCEYKLKEEGLLITKKDQPSLKNYEFLNEILISTTMSIEGKRIARYFDMLTSEQVLGTGWLTEQLSSFSDFFGTASGAYQEKFLKAKDLAIKHIKYQAHKLGANAIIGTDVKYTVTADKNMIMLAISGTPVVLETL